MMRWLLLIPLAYEPEAKENQQSRGGTGYMVEKML
jgi:hypothetical protein